MQQIGVVEHVEADHVLVRIQRATACGENCASCSGGCKPSKTIVSAKGAAGCREGDHVIIEMGSGKVMGAAVLVYLIPLVTMIAGYFIGSWIFHTETAGILSGFVFMAVCFVLISLIDRRLRQSYQHSIVKNLSKREL